MVEQAAVHNWKSVEEVPAKRIVFMLLPGVQLLDVAGPAQVFSTAKRLGACYELIFSSPQAQLVSAQGLVFAELVPLVDLVASDQVIIPGISSERDALARPLLDEQTRNWLRQAEQSGVRLASVCTAAFALGESGLLDNRRCTTHWSSVDLLRSRYPAAHVVDNLLFVNSGTITTSAGIASGIDMALGMVEQDYGPLFTAQVARHLVIYLRRNGGQQQQSIYLEYRTHLHSGVHRAQDFIINHLSEPISLQDIAAEALLSKRSLSRLFKESVGLTPIQYQQRLRLELASTLLTNDQMSVEEIAAKCGFDDVRHFRRLWKTVYGLPPSASRERNRK